MKIKPIYLIGGAIAAWWLFFRDGAAPAQSSGSGGGGYGGTAGDMSQLTPAQQTNAAANQAGNNLGAAIQAQPKYNPGPAGSATSDFTRAFSDLFNAVVGKGVQLTQPNATGTAINLNPNLAGLGGTVFSGPAQTVQGALTSAAIASGVGIGSIAPWAGGGVIMNSQYWPATINSAQLTNRLGTTAWPNIRSSSAATPTAATAPTTTIINGTAFTAADLSRGYAVTRS